jgi:hypothetical protein
MGSQRCTLPFVHSLLASGTRLRRSTLARSPTHKRNGLDSQKRTYYPQRSRVRHSHHTMSPYSTSPLSTPSGMAVSAYAAQVSAGGYPHAHGYDGTSLPPTPSSTTLVEATRFPERSKIELKFSKSGAKIVNSVVIDQAGWPLYSISSDSRCTKLHSQSDNTEVATINWDRSSPRMVFRGKKLKCKEWLPLAGPDTEYVLMPLLRARYFLS